MPFSDIKAVIRKKYAVEPLAANFIPSLGKPEPQILWVGCSDSWITETSSLDVLPEEIFVHRNLGAVLSNGDLSSTSAVDYCVNTLKVKHIIVCGHYDCRLLKEDPNAEAMQGWYKDLSKLHAANDAYLNGEGFSVGEEQRDKHLEEVYILAECEWLRKQPTVSKAIQDRGLKIDGIVFDKSKSSCVRLVEK